MKSLVTYDLVQRISNDADKWLDPVQRACDAWAIDSWAEVSMFLAQTAHESAGFRRLIESLKYSAAGLRRTWPKRFNQEDAELMQYNEWAIGERAYGGRMGNGPEGSGDGYLYRGRGLIQVTGRDGYLKIGEHIGVDDNNNPYPLALVEDPDLLLDPVWAAFASACYWDVNNCGVWAERGDFKQVTLIINGGLNGYEDRLNWYEIIKDYAP